MPFPFGCPFEELFDKLVNDNDKHGGSNFDGILHQEAFKPFLTQKTIFIGRDVRELLFDRVQILLEYDLFETIAVQPAVMQFLLWLDIIEVGGFFGEGFWTVECCHKLCLVGLLEQFEFDDDEKRHYCEYDRNDPDESLSHQP